MPSALVLLAEGAEEMETVIIVDILRRGEVDVTLAGVAGDTAVKCSRNMFIVPDTSLDVAVKKGPFDMVICPGGGRGTMILCESEAVRNVLKDQEKRGGYIAAVCTGPAVLSAHGIGKGKKVTSYPNVEDKMQADYTYLRDLVVVDGNIITSRAPGTCFEFSLAIVEVLRGSDKAAEIAAAMLMQ